MTIRSIAAAAAAIALLASPADAQAPGSTTVIGPIYSQLVTFSVPSNFVVGEPLKNKDDTTYTRVAVPKGETVDKWSEMITVTGIKGAAAAQNASAEKVAGVIAETLRKSCPDSFAAKGGVASAQTAVVVIGCGKIGEASKRSETTLVMAIKGSTDIYTLQWAERGAPADKPDVENAKWAERLQKLAPLRLCPIVPGEAAPYPSCK